VAMVGSVAFADGVVVLESSKSSFEISIISFYTNDGKDIDGVQMLRKNRCRSLQRD
jgi:hypothetical protein